MKRRKGLLALVAASVISAVALMPAAASAATGAASSGRSVVHISYAAGGSVVSPADTHNCVPVGDDGVTRAVFCADLLSNAETAQAEGMCQTISTGAIVQCPLIEIHYGLAVAGRGQVEAEYAACPHNGHPCPQGRFTVNDGGRSFIYVCDTEMWTVVNAGSEIELPSHNVFALGGNFASAHGFACK